MDPRARGNRTNREPDIVASTQRLHRGIRSSHRALPGALGARRESSRAALPLTHERLAHDDTRPPTPSRSSSFDHHSGRGNRALNFLIAAVALVVLAPLLVLIALAVKLTSPGPILYTQVRVGIDRRSRVERRARPDRRSGAERRVGTDRRERAPDRRAQTSRRAQGPHVRRGRRSTDVGGHAFRIYKFRSMCTDAECGTGAVWATRHDPRVTSIGRILRNSRLDELPQLFNVLKGDMNIVGPRPERPSIFCRLRDEIPDYTLRQRARPGITGWAQVKHTYDSCVDDVKKKIQFDLEYLRHRNVWVDLQIMARTIPVMLLKRGAR